MNEHYIKNGYQNMLVKDLKKILNDLPDDMPIVIPVINEYDANYIYGFRYVRTAQVRFSGVDVSVNKILFGISKHDKKENNAARGHA